MARAKKAVSKKRVVKKTNSRRGRPAAATMAAKLDATKNTVIKSALNRADKAVASVAKASDAVAKAADALSAARQKTKTVKTAAAKQAVVKKTDALAAAKAALAAAKLEKKLADGMISALVKFEAAQQKAYDKALAKAVKAQQRKEAQVSKKGAAPRKKRTVKRRTTAA